MIWLSIFFAWAISQANIRASFYDLSKLLLKKEIALPISCMLLYISVIVLVLRRIGFWDASATKDTILWTFGVAFVTLFNINKVSEDENFFSRIISGNLKLVIVFEFIVNLYTFSLVAELIIVPVITIVVLMNTVAENRPEYKPAETVLSYALGLFGIWLLTVN